MAKRRPKKPMLKFPKRMQKKMIVMFTVVAYDRTHRKTDVY